jgi:hypothetical protein
MNCEEEKNGKDGKGARKWQILCDLCLFIYLKNE